MFDMKMKSLYADAIDVKPMRKFAAYVLDFISALILTLVLFSIAELIMNSTPIVKDKKNSLNVTAQEMFDMVLDSGLGKENTQHVLISQNQYVSDQIKGMTYSVLVDHNDNTVSKETYQGTQAISKENDGIFHYFVEFKEANKSQFIAESKNQSGLDYYRNILKEKDVLSLFDEDSYFSFSLQTAKSIDEYYRNSSYSIGKNNYSKIETCFKFLLEKGIHDIQTYYKPYISLSESYSNKANEIYQIKNIEVLLSYLISIGIVYVLIPILLKDGRTIAFKVLGFALTDKDGNQLSFYHYLIKYLATCMECLCIIFLSGLLFFTSSAIGWLGEPLFLNVSFLTLSIYSLLIMFLSFLLCFVFPKTHQSLIEWISMVRVKDTRQFVSKTKELIKDGR